MSYVSTALRLLICLTLVLGGGPRAHAAAAMTRPEAMPTTDAAMPDMAQEHCRDMEQRGHTMTSNDDQAPTAPQPDCCKAGKCHCLAPPASSVLVGSHWIGNAISTASAAPVSRLTLSPRQRQLAPPYKPPIA